jgi:hypothetical protein
LGNLRLLVPSIGFSLHFIFGDLRVIGGDNLRTHSSECVLYRAPVGQHKHSLLDRCSIGSPYDEEVWVLRDSGLTADIELVHGVMDVLCGNVIEEILVPSISTLIDDDDDDGQKIVGQGEQGILELVVDMNFVP